MPPDSRFFGVQPTERAFVRGALLVVMPAMAVNVLVLGAVTALFLGVATARELPIVYAASALFGGALTLLLRARSQTASRAREAAGTSLGLSAALLLAFLFLPLAPRAVLFLAYPVATSLAALGVVSAYAMVHDHLDAVSAKRLLPLIGAGGTCGAMLAGACLGGLSPRIGTRPLLLLAALVAALSALALRMFLRQRARAGSTHPPAAPITTRPPPRGGAVTSIRRLLLEIARSPLLRVFALLQMPLAFASTLLKFQLDATLKENLEVDDIAAFLGALNLAANGGVLIVQLGFESRLLRALGVTVALSSTAFVLSIGALSLLLSSSLPLLASLRFGESVSRFSLARTAEDLVLLPISPGLRRVARAFVTTLLAPSAVLFASLSLALLAPRSSAPVALLMLIAAAAALGAALASKAPYRQSLREALKGRNLRFGQLTRSEHDETVATLLELVEAPDATLRLGALRSLARQRLAGADVGVDESRVVRAAQRELRQWYRLRLTDHALAVASLSSSQQRAARREVAYQAERSTETLFLLLMLIALPGDIERAYLAFCRGKRREQAFALEMLEQVLPASIRKPVLDCLAAQTHADPLARAERALGLTRNTDLRTLLAHADAEHARSSSLRRLALYLELTTPDSPEEERLMTSLKEVFALRSVELLSDLSPEELESVAGIATRTQLAAGQTVFEQGDPGNAFYVVLAGELGVERDGAHVATLREGECFGELALLDRGLRAATVKAARDCDLLCIVDEDFRELLERHPSIAIHMLAILARRSTALLERAARA